MEYGKDGHCHGDLDVILIRKITGMYLLLTKSPRHSEHRFRAEGVRQFFRKTRTYVSLEYLLR